MERTSIDDCGEQRGVDTPSLMKNMILFGQPEFLRLSWFEVLTSFENCSISCCLMIFACFGDLSGGFEARFVIGKCSVGYLEFDPRAWLRWFLPCGPKCLFYHKNGQFGSHSSGSDDI